MSSSIFDAPVDLALRPSLRALTLLFALHGALAVLIMLALPAGAAMALAALGVAASWFTLRRHPVFGFGPRALTQLTWNASGDWTLRDASGTTQDAELEGNSFVTPYLLVLNFRIRDSKRRRTRALLGDELPPEQLRRLRVRLMAPR
jgi:toxin CptA